MKRADMTRRLLSLIVIASIAALLCSCSSSRRPVVLDYDTYQIVTIGDVSYTTPNNVELESRGRSSVVHKLNEIGGATMKVSVDTSPPRDLSFDADATRRQFLHSMNKAQSRSAQYNELNGVRRVKITADGRDLSGKHTYGTLTLLRNSDTTAILSIVGPWEYRGQIDSFMERMIPKVHLPGPTDEEKFKTFEQEWAEQQHANEMAGM